MYVYFNNFIIPKPPQLTTTETTRSAYNYRKFTPVLIKTIVLIATFETMSRR